MTIRVITGDALAELGKLPDEGVHCCVTSPPYYGLRDYGVVGQIGLEPSPDEYVAALVAVFREARRVLRRDGTLWLNLGDSYATAGGYGGDQAPSNVNGKQRTNQGAREKGQHARVAGFKHKDLLGIPWMVAFALRADGWYLRQDIIWAKPNPMPESVTDRCTKAHEYLFLLSRSERYWFDAAAIAEPFADDRMGNPGAYRRTTSKAKGAVNDRQDLGFLNNGDGWNVDGIAVSRNRRSVWTVASQPFPEAHFATFPPALIEPCIKAGTSEKGCCAKCGSPWTREINQNVSWPSRRSGLGNNKDRADGGLACNAMRTSETIGWKPSCICASQTIPATVLDPFGGAGTTGLVADRLQRDAILIELNHGYAGMARRRIWNDAPLFANVAD